MIHIVEEIDEKDKQLQERFGLYGAVHYVTPEQAVGEVVQFENPGTMGKEPYQIENVDLDNRVTTVENLLTGEVIKIGDDIFPPDYNAFPRVRTGEEFSIYWLEHQKGNGEWVQTTPNIDNSRAAQKYHGVYTGHERIRLCSETYKYIPPGVLELDIFWSASEENAKVYYDGEITNSDELFQQIDAPSTPTKIGQIYINQDDAIVNLNIDPQYRKFDFDITNVLQG